MFNKLKLTAAAALMSAGLAMPAAAQESCGVVVFFANGKAVLTEQGRAVLQDYLNRNAGKPLTVTGYTDAVGSAASNQALSERRAANVAASLSGANIVLVAGGGEAVRPGTTGPNDPANRRVEITNEACNAPVIVKTTPGIGPGLALGGVGLLAAGIAALSDSSSGGTGGTGTSGTGN